jgi:hypothetical protein
LIACVVDVAISADQHDERNENDQRYGEADASADLTQRRTCCTRELDLAEVRRVPSVRHGRRL